MNADLVTVADLVTAVGKIRKGAAWSPALVERNILKARETRSGVQTVIDTLHAALDENVKTPGAISHHHYLLTAAECGTCEEREQRVNRSSQPPQIERCKRCERVLEPGIEHACRSQRPEHWDDYQAFWRANLAKQRILREAIVNDPGNYELAVRNRAGIAELKAEVEARAAQLDEELARS